MGETREQHLTFLKRFLADQSGATAIEYGMIASLLGLVMVVGLGALGDKIFALLNLIVDKLTAAVG